MEQNDEIVTLDDYISNGDEFVTSGEYVKARVSYFTSILIVTSKSKVKLYGRQLPYEVTDSTKDNVLLSTIDECIARDINSSDSVTTSQTSKALSRDRVSVLESLLKLLNKVASLYHFTYNTTGAILFYNKSIEILSIVTGMYKYVTIDPILSHLFITTYIGYGHLHYDMGHYVDVKRMLAKAEDVCTRMKSGKGSPKYNQTMILKMKLNLLLYENCGNSMEILNGIMESEVEMHRNDSINGNANVLASIMLLVSQVIATIDNSYMKSYQLLEQSLSIRMHLMNKVDIAEVQYHKALLLTHFCGSKNLSDANALIDSSLNICVKYLSSYDHPRIAECMYCQAMIKQTEGLFDAASILLNEAYELLIKIYGANSNHHRIVTVLLGLTINAFSRGAYADAIKLIQKALVLELATQKTMKIDQYCGVAYCYLMLGNVYRICSRYDDAASYLGKAYAIYTQQIHTEDHYMLIECRLSLAQLHKEKGDYTAARDQLVGCLKSNVVTREDNYLQIAAIVLASADAYRLQGHYEEALDLCDQALSSRKALLTNMHALTLEAVIIRCKILRDMNRSSEALEVLMRSSEQCKQMHLGSIHPLVASIFNDLGVCMATTAKHSMAELYFRLSLETKKSVFSDIALSSPSGELWDYRFEVQYNNANMPLGLLDVCVTLIDIARYYYSSNRVDIASAMYGDTIIPLLTNCFGKATPITYYAIAEQGICKNKLGNSTTSHSVVVDAIAFLQSQYYLSKQHSLLRSYSEAIGGSNDASCPSTNTDKAPAAAVTAVVEAPSPVLPLIRVLEPASSNPAAIEIHAYVANDVTSDIGNAIDSCALPNAGDEDDEEQRVQLLAAELLGNLSQNNRTSHANAVKLQELSMQWQDERVIDAVGADGDACSDTSSGDKCQTQIPVEEPAAAYTQVHVHVVPEAINLSQRHMKATPEDKEPLETGRTLSSLDSSMTGNSSQSLRPFIPEIDKYVTNHKLQFEQLSNKSHLTVSDVHAHRLRRKKKKPQKQKQKQSDLSLEREIDSFMRYVMSVCCDDSVIADSSKSSRSNRNRGSLGSSSDMHSGNKSNNKSGSITGIGIGRKKEILLPELEAAIRKYRRQMLTYEQEVLARDLMISLEYLLGVNDLSVMEWFQWTDTHFGSRDSGDEKLTLVEFRNSIQRLCDLADVPNWHEDDTFELLRYMDPSGDGDLSYFEVKLAFRRHALSQRDVDPVSYDATYVVKILLDFMHLKELRIKDLFNDMDKDRNGSISMDELSFVVRKIVANTAERDKRLHNRSMKKNGLMHVPSTGDSVSDRKPTVTIATSASDSDSLSFSSLSLSEQPPPLNLPPLSPQSEYDNDSVGSSYTNSLFLQDYSHCSPQQDDGNSSYVGSLSSKCSGRSRSRKTRKVKLLSDITDLDVVSVTDMDLSGNYFSAVSTFKEKSDKVVKKGAQTNLDPILSKMLSPGSKFSKDYNDNDITDNLMTSLSQPKRLPTPVLPPLIAKIIKSKIQVRNRVKICAKDWVYKLSHYDMHLQYVGKKKIDANSCKK